MKLPETVRVAIDLINELHSLQKSGNATPQKIVDLAERIETTPMFLHKIAYQLGQDGLIIVARGRGGGIKSAEDGITDITALKILHSMGYKDIKMIKGSMSAEVYRRVLELFSKIVI